MHNCKACLSPSLIFTGSIHDGNLFKCCSCGSKFISIYSSPPPSSPQDYGEAYRKNLSTSKTAALLHLFNNVLSPQDFNSLLDLGSADGEFLKSFLNSGKFISGLDADPAAAENLRSYNIDAHTMTLGESSLQLPQKYDVITMWDLIEHIDNIESSLRWISNHLKPGGNLLIVTPDANSLLDRFAGIEKAITFGKSKMLLEICLNRYHLNRFSRSGLESLLQRYNIALKHSLPVNLFSLNPDTYFNGFAPGIQKLSSASRLNKLLSSAGINLTKFFRITNKLFVVGVKQ